MMRDLLYWSAKTIFQMVVWVFVLSITWDNKSLYDRSYNLLIDNSITQEIDYQITKTWDKLQQSVKLAFIKEKAQEWDEEE